MDTYIKKIDGAWYAFGLNAEGKVFSIGRDCPASGGLFEGDLTDEGIKFVAKPMTKNQTARNKARRYGNFVKEIK